MSPAEWAVLSQDTRAAEGLRLRAYQDSLGIWTIGYGTNLQELKITEDEAERWLQRKLTESAVECGAAFPWFSGLTPARQRALIELTYNLGLTRLRGFTKMHAAIASGEFGAAADELKDSRWYQQVGPRRGDRIAEMIRHG